MFYLCSRLGQLKTKGDDHSVSFVGDFEQILVQIYQIYQIFTSRRYKVPSSRHESQTLAYNFI